MRRVVFWFCFVITILLAVRIAKILIWDINRLTDFGYGYLVSQFILFGIFLAVSIVMGLKIFRSKSNS